MGRRSKTHSSAEEKFAIVLEALRSGDVAETCRTHEISPTVFYRWKDEVEKGALAAFGGKSAASAVDQEQAQSSSWSVRWGAAISRSRSPKMCRASELWAGSFAGEAVRGPGLCSNAGSGSHRHQPLQPVLQGEATAVACRSRAGRSKNSPSTNGYRSTTTARTGRPRTEPYTKPVRASHNPIHQQIARP